MPFYLRQASTFPVHVSCYLIYSLKWFVNLAYNNNYLIFAGIIMVARKDTYTQYKFEASRCREMFKQKMEDYGTSWRILRLSSLIDQLYIKATRIRNIEEANNQKVDDPIESEYVGIVNYSIMALIQIELGSEETCTLTSQDMLELYDQKLRLARQLMKAKNHDYGEAWRLMDRTSLTDLILVKILRMKQMLRNEGQTLVSEGVDANLLDMINYALFALIKMTETKPQTSAV